MLPLTFPQQAATAGPLLAPSFDKTIAANASLIVTTAAPPTPPVLVGSAQLAATGAVDGFAIFHQIPTAQEAVVPMETRNASSYLLAFDNTNGLVLGVAVENVSAQNAVIPVIIRDDAGNVISSPGTTISLGGNGHTAFVLSDPVLGFPITANKRGTIEFDTPAGGRISVLGLRFTPPNNALTTIPALANVGTGGGSIAHLASGGDGWQTTFVLVNTGTTATSATLNFFADQTGTPAASASDISARQHCGHDGFYGHSKLGGWGNPHHRKRRGAGSDHGLGATHHHWKRQRLRDLPPQRPGSRGAAGEP